MSLEVEIIAFSQYLEDNISQFAKSNDFLKSGWKCPNFTSKWGFDIRVSGHALISNKKTKKCQQHWPWSTQEIGYLLRYAHEFNKTCNFTQIPNNWVAKWKIWKLESIQPNKLYLYVYKKLLLFNCGNFRMILSSVLDVSKTHQGCFKPQAYDRISAAMCFDN